MDSGISVIVLLNQILALFYQAHTVNQFQLYAFLGKRKLHQSLQPIMRMHRLITICIPDGKDFIEAQSIRETSPI